MPTLPQAAPRYTVSGYLTDSSSGEGLIGATVFEPSTGAGAVTNNYGFYSITLPEGRYTLLYRFVGMATRERAVTFNRNMRMDMRLPPAGVELGEVVVSAERAEREANVTSTQMSVAKLDIRQIKLIPPLLGEVDLVRAVQLLPGVTTVGEGAQGFNVRGGSIDHNLVLIDEAPVYNSSHLFGFFSVFNPDAVRDVRLYKGGIPPAYGGRLASLLDVRLKEGNNQKLQGSGGIGTIMSRAAIEGPIAKDKASFIIAGRRSYADVLARPFLETGLRESRFFFYDLTAKVNWRIDERNTVFASGYLGRDVFQFGQEFFFNWGNSTATTRWNHLFTPQLFGNATVIWSDYSYALGSARSVEGFRWDSNIRTLQGRYDFNHYLSPTLTASYGIGTLLYTFVPGKARGQGSQTIFNRLELPRQLGLEHSAYGSLEAKLSTRLTVNGGLRLSGFDYLGNRDTVVTYRPSEEEGQRGRPESRDASFVGRYGLVSRYVNPEPRLSATYLLDTRSSVKASYMRTAQYIHLITNSTAATPIDVWTPSTRGIRPQIADQLAVGYFRNFGPESEFETSAEVYYKDMQNQIDYVDGAELLLNPRLEGELLRGVGRAYGLELYVRKSTGRLTGWVSYTLSRTERLVRGINFNNWYPAQFDRTHNVVIVSSYQLRPRLSVSGTFTYLTGIPTTLPVGRAQVGGVFYPIIDGRNTSRVPDYHRLDLSVVLQRPRRRWGQSEWVFAIYNTYARRNAFSVYPAQGRTQDTRDIAEMRRLSIFGTIIPAVSYNITVN